MDKNELEATLHLMGMVPYEANASSHSVNFEYRSRHHARVLDAYFHFQTECQNIFVQSKKSYITDGPLTTNDHLTFSTIAEALVAVKEYIDFYKEHRYEQ